MKCSLLIILCLLTLTASGCDWGYGEQGEGEGAYRESQLESELRDVGTR